MATTRASLIRESLVLSSVDMLFCAGVGVLAGHFFSVISPVGGAVFGASYSVTDFVAERALKKLGCNENLATKIAKVVLSVLTSIAIASVVTSAFMDAPISLTSAGVI